MAAILITEPLENVTPCNQKRKYVTMTMRYGSITDGGKPIRRNAMSTLPKGEGSMLLSRSHNFTFETTVGKIQKNIM